MPTTPAAIGGLTIGADFIVAAVVMKAYETGQPINMAPLSAKRGSRTNCLVGTKIVVIDDVITSGQSTIQACDELEQAP